LASLLAGLFLYLLIKKRFGVLVGALTLIFFLFIPFNIYYGRTILPDPSMVAASLGGIYFFYLWIEKEKTSIISFWFLMSLLFTAAAFLLKPYALFFTLPMVCLVFERFGLSFWKKYQLYLFAIISLLPLLLWRLWMTKYPAGIPVSAWLFNGGNIRFKPAYFYWIFADRIARLISGYWGVVFVALGFLKKYKLKDFIFVLSFVVSSLVYLVVIAKGNVQHDYYQILIVPSLAMVMGLGASALLKPLENYNKIVAYLVFVVCFGFAIFFGWYFVRDYFNINNPSIVVAGEAVDQLTPKSAKVIANYNGDTSFLYQTKRSGWASYEKPLPQMVQMGADYLVIANPVASDLNFGKTYKIVAETSQYVIFNLRQKP
jgi:4-amino-4-deoxy-L-arabinose transferase-like glycosyltransferase